jgi:hypothetical protein
LADPRLPNARPKYTQHLPLPYHFTIQCLSCQKSSIRPSFHSYFANTCKQAVHTAGPNILFLLCPFRLLMIHTRWLGSRKLAMPSRTAYSCPQLPHTSLPSTICVSMRRLCRSFSVFSSLSNSSAVGGCGGSAGNPSYQRALASAHLYLLSSICCVQDEGIYNSGNIYNICVCIVTVTRLISGKVGKDQKTLERKTRRQPWRRSGKGAARSANI